MYLRFKNLKFKDLTGCWPQAFGYWQLKLEKGKSYIYQKAAKSQRP
jgi:hypothetical protein